MGDANADTRVAKMLNGTLDSMVKISLDGVIDQEH